MTRHGSEEGAVGWIPVSGPAGHAAELLLEAFDAAGSLTFCKTVGVTPEVGRGGKCHNPDGCQDPRHDRSMVAHSISSGYVIDEEVARKPVN